jgi:hypothetical protein
MYVKITNNGETFQCSPRQAVALELLMDSNGGGFATAKGYVSVSDRVKPETADITFISRFSVERLYERTINALEAMTMNDIMDIVRDNPKIKALKTDELYKAFDDRKASDIASMKKTLAGVRDDAHRQAHDRNYHKLTDGVKVHYLTEENDKGIMVPVLENGLPVVKSIMVQILEVSRNVRIAGEYKPEGPRGPGVPVILSNAMKSKLPKSCKIKALSLKDDNFEELNMGGVQFLSEDIKGQYSNLD